MAQHVHATADLSVNRYTNLGVVNALLREYSAVMNSEQRALYTEANRDRGGGGRLDPQPYFLGLPRLESMAGGLAGVA